MIKNGDTLLFQEKMVIQTDTVYFGNNTYYPGDTLYEGTCQTFETINGQIINQSDDHCLRQGLWTITDSLGNYWTGNYHDHNKVGIWKRFDKSGKLLIETEEVSFMRDTYKVKEVDYASGKPETVIDKPFLSFYIKNLVAIMVIFFVTFFGRILINSKIYNLENGTEFSPIYFHFGPLFSKNFGHSLLCTFTFWFSDYKPENRRFVIISNTMSVIALTIFFGIIIGLAATREI